MNKKSLLNLAMCSLLLGSLPVGLVGCKDYDGDIKDLNTATGDLSSQLSSLKTALDAAQNAATAAANDAKAAASKADSATAEAALAKQAAEEAKAQAIAEVMAEVEKLQGSIDGMNAENATQLAALAGRIDGIEEGLSKIDLTKVNETIGGLADAVKETNEQVAAIQLQLAALEKLEKSMTDLQTTLGNIQGSIGDLEGSVGDLEGSVGDLEGSVGDLEGTVGGIQVTVGDIQQAIADLKTKVAAIDGIKSDLKAVQDKANANATAIAANKTSIGEINTEISSIKGQLTSLSTQISTKVSNAVNTIAGILSKRLTSVTLIPDLYVGGIPTISFESAQYTKKVLKNNQWVNATTGKTNYVITNNATTAQYRLNPGTLKIDDIDVKNMEYVTKVATTRAADPAVVTVSNAKIENNGLLTVNLGKANTNSLNLSGNKIYTVSLKVPVASKHLFEGETSADVYSEFTRLEETYFTPELRFVKNAALISEDNNGHLWNDSTVLYNSSETQLIAKNLVYNKTYDLDKLVEGCKVVVIDPTTGATSHTNMTKANLEKYGLSINYQVAKRAYTPTSPDKTNQQAFARIEGSILTPVAASGTAGNENIIGKQPIIRATLYDSNNHNVIEVGYFKVRFTAEEMKDKVFDLTVSDAGLPCTGATHEFTWDYMATEVLEHLNDEKGMSKEDFWKIYYYGGQTNVKPNDYTNLVVNEVWSPAGAATPVMTWTASENDLGLLKVGDNRVVYTRTVNFYNPQGLYPNVVLNLKWTIDTKVGAATLGTTNPIKWTNNTMKVTVVPMGIPYNGSQTAEYKTNILEGRNKPYVNGLLSCAQYNIDYAPMAEQTQSYLGEPLTFTTGFAPWTLTSANQNSLTEVNYVIEHNENGKNLASKGGTIKVNFSSDINGLAKNRYAFGTINLEVVKILTLTTTAASGITDNSSAVTMNLADNLLIRDAYQNVVAQTNTSANPYASDYWMFYELKQPVFDDDNIKVAQTADGANGVSLASLNMTAIIDNTSGKLTFQNNGSAIVSDAYLIVPVTVEHKWGVLKGTVAVPLKAKL